MKIAMAAIVLCMLIPAPPMRIAGFPAQDLSSKDQWGERSNSPGAKLTYKEVSRSRVSDRTVVTYNLFASGLPKDQHYAFWVLNVGANPRAVADAYLNGDGKVVNVLADPKRQIAEDPIDAVVFGGKGEPIQFALISDDGRSHAFAEIVPFPIEATAGSCNIMAIEATPNYQGVIVRLVGLQPSEDLLVDTKSDSEAAQSKAKADERGNYNTLLFPFVKGKRSGKARVSVTAKSCKIGIEFPWGEGSYQ